jgi:hypothetical protein
MPTTAGITGSETGLRTQLVASNPVLHSRRGGTPVHSSTSWEHLDGEVPLTYKTGVHATASTRRHTCST